MLHSRPRFAAGVATRDRADTPHTLEHMFKTGCVGGFINCARTREGANVVPVMFGKRQLYMASRDIQEGEEILDWYKWPDGDVHEEYGWYSRKGISHSVEVVLHEAKRDDSQQLSRGASASVHAFNGESLDGLLLTDFLQSEELQSEEVSSMQSEPSGVRSGTAGSGAH